MSDHVINAFTKGTWNLGDDENIPKDAAQASSNWITQDGRLRLSYGRNLIGAEGGSGKITGLHYGYKVDGSKVLYRKTLTAIQYLKGTTWTNVVTGLTSGADYTFSNYSSLAGAFTYASGIDGIWKIINANPTSPVNVTDTTKNFKGYSMIDKGRMLLWNRPEDKTGLYGSHIDRQNATVYTTVTAESVGAFGSTTYSGTLAFKAAGVYRSCFGQTVTGTVAAGTETFTDNYLGVLTSNRGGTGTINYATGAYSVTFSAVTITNPVTTSYQWEDSNVNGITDFTLSATRVAGEGFQFPQDIGGDAILNVVVGIDGAYYSMKSQSAYKLSIGPTDSASDTTNEVYRRELGLPFFRAATSTKKGIVFMNAANPSKPELTILKRNEIGTDIEPYPLLSQFKFSNYDYTDCCVDTYERYIVVACRSTGSLFNDTILLCDTTTETVDETAFPARMFAKNAGVIYGGSPTSESVYQLYNGFDDDGLKIINQWSSKGEQYEALGIQESLKKIKKLRIKGHIDPNQTLQVYVSYDDIDFELVGTIVGTGSYVDATSPISIGNYMIGEVEIGESQIGGPASNVVYPYYAELKLKTPKYRKRTIKLVADGFGYIDVEHLMDRDILIFEKRIPKRFRSKQNVSLDGLRTNIRSVHLLDSYSEATANNDFFQLPYFGQAFTCTEQSTISSVKFYLQKQGLATGTSYAELYTLSGTFGTNAIPGTLLATSDPLDIADFSITPSLVEFIFTGVQRYSLVNGTNYVIVIKNVLTSTGTNYVSTYNDTGTTTWTGTTSTQIGGVWTSIQGTIGVPNISLCYYVYGLSY